MLGRMLKYLVPRGVRQKVRNYLERRVGVPSVEWSMENLSKLGFCPRVVIDVGAYKGEWTQLCKRSYPDAQVLMVEPQGFCVPDLERLVATATGVRAAHVLLGAQSREQVPFHENVHTTASSVLPDATNAAHTTQTLLPMKTLAELTRGTPFERPNFIKLDVQGYELEVLRGGIEQLRAAEVVLMEVNLLAIYKGAPLLDETVAFMRSHGFRAYDIASFFRRPFDNALWQVDMFFAHESSRLVAYQGWS